MKCIVIEDYGSSEVMKIMDVPVPEPGPGEILLKLHAAGVNPVDTYLRSGSQGYAPPLPWIPGMDGAGTVAVLSPDVSDFAIGERVFVRGALTGTYGEYCLSSTDKVYPLAEELTWAQGACLGVPYFTAARALFTKGKALDCRTVLIHGATGGVGLACLQLAKDCGSKMFGTAGSPEGAVLVEALGASCFSHRESSHFAALKEASGGMDLIVEMLADVNLGNDFGILAPGGRVVIVGSRGEVTINPRDLMGGEGTVTGMKVGNSSPDEFRQYASLIEKGIVTGSVRPIVAESYPLDEAGKAHEAVIAGPHRGNIVLEIR